MKIIVAYDGSDSAKRALEHLVWFNGAKPQILIVTVLDGMALDANGDPFEPDPADVLFAEERLSAAIDYIWSFAEIRVEPRILVGDARGALLKAIHDEKADLLVLGSRGLSFGRRIVFGSVSTDMLHHAECPVMVVK